MSNADIFKENQILKEEIEKLNKELTETREHLKKYTSPFDKKIYYENNKEQIKEKVKEYKEKNKVSKDVIKERNKKAYQKRKEKLEKEKLENI